MLIQELKFFSMVKPQPHQLPRLASDEAPHLGVGAHCFNAKKCGYDKDPKDPVHPFWHVPLVNVPDWVLLCSFATWHNELCPHLIYHDGNCKHTTNLAHTIDNLNPNWYGQDGFELLESGNVELVFQELCLALVVINVPQCLVCSCCGMSCVFLEIFDIGADYK